MIGARSATVWNGCGYAFVYVAVDSNMALSRATEPRRGRQHHHPPTYSVAAARTLQTSKQARNAMRTVVIPEAVHDRAHDDAMRTDVVCAAVFTQNVCSCALV
jgi:hypothetical protein